ncbi:DUF433 domain-containing protein [Alkalicaulis satelles]|uniref:DUF433 domain-containing protein n=1 Tax=Alkalicaulis satelles TaxID=2609175 RepID=A0A5M6ZJY5_9PROT|nr:DUF433 domain-containing protein [Alkalicaulis satelles]KAA5803977.1 DUF433 domain-containing protein [Alkalicaulis satelles]
MNIEQDHPRISIDPAIMFGKPCIKGTRVPVYLILRKLSSGMSEAEIHEAYPHLEQGDVQAVLAYAADQLEEPVVAAQ